VTIPIESAISTKIPTIQVLTIEILAAASTYLLALYILKALKSPDFELLKQASPKFLTKYIKILENIIVH